jgi:Holliday junction resolvase RusA-like endonuclease
MRISIKPLSINEAYRGRRFKTKEYKQYIKDCNLLLPNKSLPDGKLKVTYKFGLSSIRGDIDNPIKPFQDIISKRYKFNDNKIYKVIVEKEDVSAGEEYVEFYIEPLEGQNEGDLTLIAMEKSL